VPSDDDRFHVLEGDGVNYVARPGLRNDVILVDAYDRRGMAPQLATARFFLHARNRLTLGGVLVMNIYGDTYERACHFAMIRSVFGKRVIALPVREDDNLIVLAFRTDNAIRNWARRERLAQTLQKRFGLNFPRYVRKMRRSPKVTALHPLR
jgi:spermidine synthase